MAKALEVNAGSTTRNRTGARLFFLLLMVGSVGALYNQYPEWFDLSDYSEPQKPAPAIKPVSVKPAQEAASRPSFDVAYADPNGGVVAAGRGEPDWVVKLQSNGTTLGEAKADENGEWVINLDKPLPPGEHSLSLSATDPQGKQTLLGQHAVALSIKPQDVAASDRNKSTIAAQAEKTPALSATTGKVTQQAAMLPKNCDRAIVQGGDTLWAMAARCYGNGVHFTKIYQSNRPLLRDPNLIYPEQTLVMPH